MVTLDLLNDLVARLDDLLGRLGHNTERFRAALRADGAQDLRPCSQPTRPEVNPTNPELKRVLRPTEPQCRSRDQLMLELHCLHTRLGVLLVELEQSRE